MWALLMLPVRMAILLVHGAMMCLQTAFSFIGFFLNPFILLIAAGAAAFFYLR